jgi:hypothetical protein
MTSKEKEEDEETKDLPSNWIESFSKKYNTKYYFNTLDGRTSWTFPTEVSSSSSSAVSKKRSLEGDEGKETNFSKKALLERSI